MPHDPHTSMVLAWIEKGESDFKAISILLPSPDCPFEAVCFHAQQAAEKYLKALLTFYQIPFPKIHDLERLAGMLRPRVDLGLAEAHLTDLSDSAVFPRYPGFEEDVRREDAERAYRTARQVKRAVLDTLAQEGIEVNLSNRPTESEEER